ncbi:MAG: phenylalanine--tRNA ligase subunit beta, partial [Lachnospiraceae bacterium]|nr:phenylalanine--tRNA ligase subunit beta [Lachnospiraceae bacterium]
MNTSYNWIKAYVPGLSCSYQEYSDKLTLSGTKVEEFKALDRNLDKIVVGEILKIEKHPDADKLVVCQVNVGSETLQIVTGATNVKEGQKVPVVLVGGKVAGGHDGGPLPENGIEIKAGKLRGVDSAGMMCSIEELGSSREFYPEAPEDGIYILPDSVKPGDDVAEILGLHDAVYEYEITSNRADCYSVLGIAREVAATFKLPFNAPTTEVCGNKDARTEDFISIEIKDTDLCSQFCARVCTDVKIGPSPQWMQRRLSAVGIRPINNLVDITNYVMAEYGQPMHAYDLDDIAGKKIIVKRASDGEKFITLDGQERELDSEVLTICDVEKAVGIAGIMGGENSMITDNVKTVLFEAATFNGTNIRKSSRRIGLRTDASSIFEKGLEPHNAIDAINRACQLMNELDCGKPAEGMVRVGLDLPEKKKLSFVPDKYNSLLGTDVSKDEMLDIFNRLEVEYDESSNTLSVPYFRQDLLRDADMAEEVARFYGYDKVPVTLPSSSSSMGGLNKDMRIRNIAASVAEHYGFSQAYCYSFESPRVFDALRLPEDSVLRKAIKISNPLGEDFS